MLNIWKTQTVGSVSGEINNCTVVFCKDYGNGGMVRSIQTDETLRKTVHGMNIRFLLILLLIAKALPRFHRCAGG